MNKHCQPCICEACIRADDAQRRETETQKLLLFDEMREALTKVLMVAILPRDVSGCQMVEDARQTLFRANALSRIDALEPKTSKEPPCPQN